MCWENGFSVTVDSRLQFICLKQEVRDYILGEAISEICKWDRIKVSTHNLVSHFIMLFPLPLLNSVMNLHKAEERVVHSHESTWFPGIRLSWAQSLQVLKRQFLMRTSWKASMAVIQKPDQCPSFRLLYVERLHLSHGTKLRSTKSFCSEDFCSEYHSLWVFILKRAERLITPKHWDKLVQSKFLQSFNYTSLLSA